MITANGENVWCNDNKYGMEPGGIPTLATIGQALGRIPRFVGHTREWYPVLAHSIVVYKLMPAGLGIFGLMHDFSEAVCSDVPTPWKTQAAMDREDELQARIYAEHGIVWPLPEWLHEAVHEADMKAQHAEAHVLGHPAAEQIWPNVDTTAFAHTESELINCRRFLDIDFAVNTLKEYYDAAYEELVNFCITDLTRDYSMHLNALYVSKPNSMRGSILTDAT